MVEENGSLHSVVFTDLLSKLNSTQQEHQDAWLAQDSPLLNEYILIQTFQSEEIVKSNWTRFSFPCPRDYSNVILLEETENKPLNIDEEGLNLVNSLVFPHISLSLRALAADIRLKVKLSRQSAFEIILRADDRLSDYCPVIRISKDQDLRGFFIYFGTLNLANNSFAIKKQFQLPEVQVSVEESREFEILITDNGDESIFVNLSDYSKSGTSKQFSASCPRFLPKLTPCKFCMIGTGASCVVKSILVKYRSRHYKTVKKRGKDCVCSII